jgi:hypothetical protein
MKWLGRMFKRLTMLVVVTATLTAVIVVLDAVLSPDDHERRAQD